MNGYIKIAVATPVGKVADYAHNVQQVTDLMANASDEGASIVVFPELCLTSYSCGDLFAQPHFVNQASEALENLLSLTHTMPVTAVVGLPVTYYGRVYNVAVVINKGNIYGAIPKCYLNAEESRSFSSGIDIHNATLELCGQTVPFGIDVLFKGENTLFGIEIGNDIFAPIAPSCHHTLAGASVILNSAASPDIVGSKESTTEIIKAHSSKTSTAYIYNSCGYGESSTDKVFGGLSLIAEAGDILAENQRFSLKENTILADIDIEKLNAIRIHNDALRLSSNSSNYRITNIPLRNDKEDLYVNRTYNPHPFVAQDSKDLKRQCDEIFEIQVNAFAQRYTMSFSKCAVIGISGGVDSTLALLVATSAMDKLGLPRQNILGVTMPGFGTTDRTYNNAIYLMKALGITTKEISIKEACLQHFKDIELAETDRSVTYENSQARERTQILMDIANKMGGLVIGTGDLSEVALGWATYNGDHMSMYGVNASVPKTLIRHILRNIANDKKYSEAQPYLLDIIDTPISPELLPADKSGNIAQKTEDLVGPYELHDFFIYHFVRYGYRPTRLFFMACCAFPNYDKATIKKWLIVFLRRFFNQQFKRSAMPDGPQTGCITLSPRGGWNMPSDTQSALWIAEANELED